MFALYELLKDISRLLLGSNSSRRGPGFLLAAAAGSCLLLVALVAAGLTVFGRASDPFTYRRVNGSILYEGDDIIPSGELVLTFVPVFAAEDGRRPRPGNAVVAAETGRFDSASTLRQGDGLASGKHKVLVTGPNRLPLSTDVVPKEYAIVDETPLEVDTRDRTFDLKVRRPARSSPAVRPPASR